MLSFTQDIAWLESVFRCKGKATPRSAAWIKLIPDLRLFRAVGSYHIYVELNKFPRGTD